MRSANPSVAASSRASASEARDPMRDGLRGEERNLGPGLRRDDGLTRMSKSGPPRDVPRLEASARASRRGAQRAKREVIDGELRVAAAADTLLRWLRDGAKEAAA